MSFLLMRSCRAAPWSPENISAITGFKGARQCRSHTKIYRLSAAPVSVRSDV